LERSARTAKELLELIKLSVREHSYPSELSGGAKQKTGLARALASGSNLLFLDEPLGSLDAKVRDELRYEIRDLVRDLELTAIHITHDQEEAMSIADKVIVMKAGRLIEIASPYELYTNPKSLFVANFVGEANFLEGMVTKSWKDGCLVETENIQLETSDKLRKEGEKVVVAIRPEYVSMEKKDNNSEGFTGYVENQDFEGSTIRYEVILKEHQPFIVRLPQIPRSTAFKIGDEVSLHILPHHILVYPPPEIGLQKELALE
jgi:putative spermidine/putrescine transport system ATP-binding protein